MKIKSGLKYGLRNSVSQVKVKSNNLDEKIGKNNSVVFLISYFRRVLNVVCFLLGNSLASEFYMSTFRNTLCSIFIGG